jgi:hypothetical protein
LDDARPSPILLAGPVGDIVDGEPLPGDWLKLLRERNALRAQLAATTAELADALACVEEWRTLAEQRLVLLEQQNFEAEHALELHLLRTPESFG